jgi:outer membrane protein assembly factor BamB
VVCFNKRNGEVIWKSQNDVPGHSGPVIADIGGVKQLVSFTAEAVIGLEASHGALLWRHPVKTRLGRHIATPVIVGDMVMVASFQAGLIGIKIRHDENRFKAEQAWVARDSAINFSSPVAIGHHLYGVGPARDLICVDIQTGKLAWAKDGFFTSPPGRTHASFLVMGDAILVLTDTGWLVLIAPDPAECRELSRVQVCGANWCNPAYADGRLYLRDAQELLCLQLLP